MQGLQIGLAVHGQQGVGKAGVQAHHVAALHLDAVGLEDAHQRVVAHGLAAAAQVVFEVDHHAPALGAVLREVFDAQRIGLRPGVAREGLRGLRVFGAGPDVLARPVAVVEHRLGHAVAVGVEQAAHVGQAVPLRGVLQAEQGHVVVDHVRELGVFRRVGPAKALLAGAGAVADHREALRRLAARVHAGATRQVKRQREAEAQALAHLGHTLQHLLARHQVHAAALVVRAELPPARALGRVCPTSGHGGSGVQHRQHVLGRRHAHLDVGVRRHAADVGTEDDAFFAVEGMTRRHGLDGKAVQAGAGHLARTHRVEQRGLVDQPPARGVHHDHAGLAQGQALAVEQAAVVRGERAMQ